MAECLTVVRCFLHGALWTYFLSSREWPASFTASPYSRCPEVKRLLKGPTSSSSMAGSSPHFCNLARPDTELKSSPHTSLRNQPRIY
ncbi:unnamed protein product [Boreogadus saida]